MDALGTDAERQAVETAFSECRAISIDYGIMENGRQRLCALRGVRLERRGHLGLGLPALAQGPLRQRRACRGVLPLRHALVDRLAACGQDRRHHGLKEYIVVDTDDVLMVCPRSEEQNIKKFIDEVKFHNGDKHI